MRWKQAFWCAVGLVTIGACWHERCEQVKLKEMFMSSSGPRPILPDSRDWRTVQRVDKHGKTIDLMGLKCPRCGAFAVDNFMGSSVRPGGTMFCCNCEWMEPRSRPKEAEDDDAEARRANADGREL